MAIHASLQVRPGTSCSLLRSPSASSIGPHQAIRGTDRFQQWSCKRMGEGVLRSRDITCLSLLCVYMLFLPLEGHIPEELGNMSAMTSLALSRNDITGESLCSGFRVNPSDE